MLPNYGYAYEENHLLSIVHVQRTSCNLNDWKRQPNHEDISGWSVKSGNVGHN